MQVYELPEPGRLLQTSNRDNYIPTSDNPFA
jgi:hypothetical protein